MSLPLKPAAPQAQPRTASVALLGNPNAGKTTLFNALTGLRARTANFPGTTVEHRVGRIELGEKPVQLVDLPGLYSIEPTSPEEQVAADVLHGRARGQAAPDAVVLVLDATNLSRNLYLASEALDVGRPVVVALTMADRARRKGLNVDRERLSRELGCPVVPVVATAREGIDELRSELAGVLERGETAAAACCSEIRGCSGCPYAAGYEWAERIGSACVRSPVKLPRDWTNRIDKVLTHPIAGLGVFTGVMLGLFAMIFWLAEYPMNSIDAGFAALGGWVSSVLPDGVVQSLLVDGVIAGVGGMLIFLPQICILFFVLSLLEDTGYLARVALVMDRLMGRVGLPGKAFVPLLSAHACAVPAIMASRVVEDRRDRLVTILIAPLMSCSARVPVYAMVAALLFASQPIKAAMLFMAAYATGVIAALGAALVLGRSVLKGKPRPLLIELPDYRLPSLRNAFTLTVDRGRVFVYKAGTVILLLSVIMWALASFPATDPPAEAVALQTQAASLVEAGQAAEAETLLTEASELTARHALSYSLAGRMGELVEPVIRPLGFDDRIGVGLISSFAARELVVSTLSVLYGVSEEGGHDSLYASLRKATHADGTPVFSTAACLSLLVFFVLAMQCMATLAVTRRETGSWKWPALQMGYMTALAYVASLAIYHLTLLLTT
ncbi:MAG: ferrous iron transporter B [Phycisphaeraceae bacterium]